MTVLESHDVPVNGRQIHTSKIIKLITYLIYKLGKNNVVKIASKN